MGLPGLQNPKNRQILPRAGESSGGAGGFACFWKRFILKQLVSIHTFDNRLKKRRTASVFELSSPQYRRRRKFRVIFAG
jgi:hypothetical protein